MGFVGPGRDLWCAHVRRARTIISYCKFHHLQSDPTPRSLGFVLAAIYVLNGNLTL